MARKILATADWKVKDKLMEQVPANFELKKDFPAKFKNGRFYFESSYLDKESRSFLDIRDSYLFDLRGYRFIHSSYTLSGADEESVNNLQSKIELLANEKIREKEVQ